MTWSRSLIVTLALLGGATGCDRPGKGDVAAADSTLFAQRLSSFAARLVRPDSGSTNAPIAMWELPRALAEVSGLTLAADGRLFTHGDSRGKIFEVDYRRGTVVKEFAVGDKTLHGDFEAITRVGDTLILLTSDGMLYRFGEGADGKSVPAGSVDTGLGDKCEFESMAYDSTSNSLLLACKRVFDKTKRDSLIVYRWPAELLGDAAKPAAKPRVVTYLAVPVASIVGANGWTGLRPSDITIDPFNGNYLIVASRELALFEITPTGAVVFAKPLPPGHQQPEGVALTKDSILIISDEAKLGTAKLTLYKWRM